MLTQSGVTLFASVWQKKTLTPKTGLILQVIFLIHEKWAHALSTAQPISFHTPLSSMWAALQHTMPPHPIHHK
jgi:hypothetical protein